MLMGTVLGVQRLLKAFEEFGKEDLRKIYANVRESEGTEFERLFDQYHTAADVFKALQKQANKARDARERERRAAERRVKVRANLLREEG